MTKVAKDNEIFRGLFRELEIINDLGLHARSAAQIAQIAGKARDQVWVERDGEAVDATSTIDILTLACGKGIRIIVRVASPRDRGVLDEIAALVENSFGE